MNKLGMHPATPCPRRSLSPPLRRIASQLYCDMEEGSGCWVLGFWVLGLRRAEVTSDGTCARRLGREAWDLNANRVKVSNRAGSPTHGQPIGRRRPAIHATRAGMHLAYRFRGRRPDVGTPATPCRKGRSHETNFPCSPGAPALVHARLGATRPDEYRIPHPRRFHRHGWRHVLHVHPHDVRREW